MWAEFIWIRIGPTYGMLSAFGLHKGGEFISQVSYNWLLEDSAVWS
jgi:hypothetical protein